MIEYPDTSFICASYRIQANHDEAVAYKRAMKEPLHFTSMLEFEFLQATIYQVFVHTSDSTKGFRRQLAEHICGQWHFDCATGVNVKVAYGPEAVTKLALAYSDLHTRHGGHRALDILHVATAVHLGARTFLTFDARQKALAKSAGLKVPFK